MLSLSITILSYNIYANKKALLGMTHSKVESVKIIGTRDIDMDSKAKAVFTEINNESYTKPYFNDAQEKI